MSQFHTPPFSQPDFISSAHTNNYHSPHLYQHRPTQPPLSNITHSPLHSTPPPVGLSINSLTDPIYHQSTVHAGAVSTLPSNNAGHHSANVRSPYFPLQLSVASPSDIEGHSSSVPSTPTTPRRRTGSPRGTGKLRPPSATRFQPAPRTLPQIQIETHAARPPILTDVIPLLAAIIDQTAFMTEAYEGQKQVLASLRADVSYLSAVLNSFHYHFVTNPDSNKRRKLSDSTAEKSIVAVYDLIKSYTAFTAWNLIEKQKGQNISSRTPIGTYYSILVLHAVGQVLRIQSLD